MTLAQRLNRTIPYHTIPYHRALQRIKGAPPKHPPIPSLITAGAATNNLTTGGVENLRP
jgi:hypothetical protein